MARSFHFAFKGVFTALREERNFRVQALYGLLVLVLLLVFRPAMIWMAMSGLSVILLLSLELVNSSLERAVDLACSETNTMAGDAKDMAAAAVMLVSFCSAGVVLMALSSCIDSQALLGLGGIFMMSIFHRLDGRVPT